MVAIERGNPRLKGILPVEYARPAVDRQRLGELIDMIGTSGPDTAGNRSKDLLGRVYESCLAQFAGAEGKNGAAVPLPPAIRCLVLGRMEDYQLKGLDLAAKALGCVVASWKQGNPPKLVVRGAPVGTDAELRARIGIDSDPTELDVVVRHYSADEIEIRNDLREASLVLMPSKERRLWLGRSRSDCLRRADAH